ncbi:alkane 1-monooxygenase [Bdellovibrio reynosensis]|uniref:Alkane 1-monooxygenase n=1 Tax=Bdellovibrio reynosensis TaxID=2835041 RepID=A0ABY4CBK6_9BACT|nr:alkane 1-monooxygenase [Bdellovibrio reynosensis]UOF01829.1 alkane 1-monooxygenase [Bdellovibrio reynosensis]
MSAIQNAFYFIPYAFATLAVAGGFLGGLYTFLGFIGIFIIHPLLDNFLFKKYEVNDKRPSQKLALLILLSTFPFLVLFGFLGVIFSLKASNIELMGLILSFGTIMGFMGITTAHELIHHKDKRLRLTGNLLLSLVNFTHYSVEHVFAHHKNVATPEDPATARKNEWIYTYFVRSYFMGLKEAFLLERKRLKSLRQFFLKNRVIAGMAAQTAGDFLIYLIFGERALLFWLGQSLVAILLLQTADYIEHYGLVRKRNANGLYEPAKACHSWDSYQGLTNYSLINLGYHSYHHLKPGIPFTELHKTEQSQKLPHGYSAMALLAFIPPIYFKIMNPRLPQEYQ